MKKLLSILLFTLITYLTTTAQSSFFIGGGIGGSSKKVLANEITIGKQVKKMLFNVSMLSHVSDIVDNQTAFCFKAGPILTLNQYADIEITAGAALNLRSTDVKSLNTLSPAVSIVYMKALSTEIRPVAQIYTGLHYIDRAVLFTIGMRVSFSKQNL